MLLDLTWALGWPQALALLVGLQRLGELALSARNARWLKGQGAVELGDAHYRYIVGLQVLWLLALLLLVSPAAPLCWGWLALFLALQLGRVWVIGTLGRYWTTRVYHLPARPVVTRGPYRWVKHPNYVVVVAEVAVLPLVVGAWWIAALFAPLQLALILWRLRAEEPALRERRAAGRRVSGGHIQTSHQPPGEPAGRRRPSGRDRFPTGSPSRADGFQEEGGGEGGGGGGGGL